MGALGLGFLHEKSILCSRSYMPVSAYVMPNFFDVDDGQRSAPCRRLSRSCAGPQSGCAQLPSPIAALAFSDLCILKSSSLPAIPCRNAVPAGSSFLPFMCLYRIGWILDPLVEENRPFCDQLVAEDTTVLHFSMMLYIKHQQTKIMMIHKILGTTPAK